MIHKNNHIKKNKKPTTKKVVSAVAATSTNSSSEQQQQPKRNAASLSSLSSSLKTSATTASEPTMLQIQLEKQQLKLQQQKEAEEAAAAAKLENAMSDEEDESDDDDDRIRVRGLLSKPTLPTFREVRKSMNEKGKSFLEHVQEVKIMEKVQHNTNRYQSHELERDEDDQATLAYDMLLKWSEKDLTDNYVKFFKSMSQLVRSLPLALYNNSKGIILQVFITSLTYEGQTAYEAIFDVLTALAKDLREEFYPNLPELFNHIVELIEARDTKRNTLVFTTLAFLFKYLSKYMLNDLASWFKRYSKLIGNSKWYIRKFAAESFSFLVNKLPEEQLPEYIDKTFELLAKKPTQDMFDGTSQLFFETMKTVYGHFHSRMPLTLGLLFKKLEWITTGNASVAQKKEELQRRFTLMQKCSQLLMDHSRSKNVASDLWKLYTNELERVITNWLAVSDQLSQRISDEQRIIIEGTGMQVGHVVGLMTGLISRLRSVEEYMQKTIDLIVDKKLLQSKLPPVALGSILTYVQTAITTHHKHIFQQIPGIFFNVLCLNQSEQLLSFFKEVMKVLYTNQSDDNSEQSEFLRQILQYVTKEFSNNEDEGLAFLVNFIASMGEDSAQSFSVKCDELLQKIMDVLLRECEIIQTMKTDTLVKLISVHSSETLPFNGTKIWACLKCISYFDVSEELFESSKLLKHLSNIFYALQAAICAGDDVKAEVVAVAANALHTLTTLSKLSIDSFKVMHNSMDNVILLLTKQSSHLHVLKAVDLYLQVYSNGDALPHELFLKIWESLEPNLHSRVSDVRFHTLKVLTKFEQTPLTPSNVSGQYNGPCDILIMLRDSEETGIDWQISRKKIYELEKALQHVQRYRERVPDHMYRMLSHYVIGGLFIKFSIAWPPCIEIAKYLIAAKFSLFWDIFYPIFAEIYSESLDEIKNRNIKAFIYKREQYLKMPFVKFENYQKAFEIRSLNALESIFASEFDHSGSHTDMTTYMDMMWDLLEDCGEAAGSRPQDVCDFFSLFYERELLSYENKSLIVLLPDSKLALNLRIVLSHLARLSQDFLEAEANTETCTKLLNLIQKLLSTSNTEIQHLTIDCLQIFNLPWLRPYIESIHKFINIRQSTSILKQLPLNARKIHEEHRSNIIPLIIQILEPALMKYDMRKAKKGKVTSQQAKWQSRVNEVVKYFSALRKEEMKLFFVTIFKRLLVVVDSKDNDRLFGIDFVATFNATNPSKIKHLLSFFKAIFAAQENYVKHFDSILEIMTIIVQVCVGSVSSSTTQMEIDEDPESSTVNKVHSKTDKTRRQLKEAEAEAIEMLTTYFDLHQQYTYEESTLNRLMDLFNFEFAKFTDVVPSLHRLLQIHFTWFKYSALNYLVYQFNLAERIIKILPLPMQVEDFGTVIDLLSNLLSHKNTQFGSNAPKNILSQVQNRTIGVVLLQPHCDQLLNHLYLVNNRDREIRKTYTNKCFGIVDRMSDYFTEESPAEVILYFYGRIFNNNRVADSHADKVLDLFNRYLPRAGTETRAKYIKVFSSLFITHTNQSYRKSMCEIIERTEKSMEYTAKIIFGLNCYTASRLDQIDYSARIDTFNKLIQGESSLVKLTELQLYPIVTNLLFYLTDEQWSIRDNAAKAMRAIVRVLAKHEDDTTYSELKQLVVSHVKNGATSEKVLDLNEYLPILAEFILFKEYQDIKPLHKFLLLLSESAVEKKQKALKLFSSVVLPNEGKQLTTEMSQETLYGIFVPMLIHLLWSNEASIAKQVKAIITKLTPHLRWEFGEKMMNNFMNMISMNNKASKKAVKRRGVALSIICDLLEIYPLDKLQDAAVSTDKIDGDGDVEMTEGEQEEEKPEKPELPEASRIRNYFVNVIVPMLQENLWDKKEDISVVKLNIAFLVIKILKRCSKERLQRELSKIILSLIGKLKSKKVEQQRECQNALLDILYELGSQYFHFTLQKLVDALREGYEVDVLYTTLFAMLKTLKNKMKNVKIDGAVDLILDVLLHDITLPPSLINNKKKGQKFETEQDVKDDAGFHMHNQNVLFASFEILAQVMNFELSMDTVISRVDAILVTVHSSAVLKRFEGVFEKVLAGLAKNPTVNQSAVVQFATQKVNEKGLYQRKFEQTNRDAYNRYQVSKAFLENPEQYYLVQPEPGRLGAIESNLDSRLHQLGTTSNEHYIVQFVIALVDNCLKMHQIKDITLLDTLVPKLIKYVSGKHLKLALAALRVLVSLQKHKDSAANKKRQDILDSILELMLNTGVDTTNETWDTLFSAVKFFLDDSGQKDGAKFSEQQLDVLLDMIRLDITKAKEPNVKPFQLLHTLVERKVMTTQIYDLIDKVRTILLKVVDQAIQSQCIHILSKFYLNYPFTPEVLQEHLNFLFKNVINEHLSFEGKLAIIKMIHTIIDQFPVELLNEKVEYIFCPLILQLANERQADSAMDVETRADKLLEEALYTFMRKINEESFKEKVMTMICKWLATSKLKAVAIHACAIAARVANGGRIKHSGVLDSKILPEIQSVIKEMSKKENAKRSKILLLKNSINTMAVLFEHGIVKHSTIDNVWSDIVNITKTTSSHSVRVSALDLISVFLAKTKNNKNSKVVDESRHMINLLDMSYELLKLNDLHMVTNTEAFTTALIKTIIITMDNLFHLTNSKIITEEKCTNILQDYFLKVQVTSIKTPDSGERNASLSLQKIIMLKLFVALSKKFNSQMNTYLPYMTPLLYRCTEDKSSTVSKKIVTQQVVDLAKRVKEEIKNLFNYERFMKSYDEGKLRVDGYFKSSKEKSDRKAVIDPILYAKKKLNSTSLSKRKREEALEEANDQEANETDVVKHKSKKIKK